MAAKLSAPVDVQIELTQACNWRAAIVSTGVRWATTSLVDIFLRDLSHRTERLQTKFRRSRSLAASRFHDGSFHAAGSG